MSIWLDMAQQNGEGAARDAENGARRRMKFVDPFQLGIELGAKNVIDRLNRVQFRHALDWAGSALLATVNELATAVDYHVLGHGGGRA